MGTYYLKNYLKMEIFSAAEKDLQPSIQSQGGYEWWYFDGISHDGKYTFVMIFYRGNPFSHRYIRALEEDSSRALPAQYPAVSIVLYKYGSPIYYSFTEYPKEKAKFNSSGPTIQMGKHTAKQEETEGGLQYVLDLDERLRSGDEFYSRLYYKGIKKPVLFDDGTSNVNADHGWNLTQPRAEVRGEFQLQTDGEKKGTINFKGTGYHDANAGKNPLRNDFKDWYWGRFHFEETTLIYYLMNKRDERQEYAWLLDGGNNVIQSFEEANFGDYGYSVFGLYQSHKMEISAGSLSIQIQQSEVVDNGPFYRRFISDAFLYDRDAEYLQKATGITEYIRPDRIYWRSFWP